MPLVDWREELKALEERIRRLKNEGTQSILKRSISELADERPIRLRSTSALRVAAIELAQADSEFALVQDAPDAIQGVLCRETLEKVLNSPGIVIEDLTVANVMDRKICIEPESASVLEVMDRMTLGFCHCTVIVDTIGRPKTIVSPRSLFFAVSGQLPGAAPYDPRDSETKEYSVG